MLALSHSEVVNMGTTIGLTVCLLLAASGAEGQDPVAATAAVERVVRGHTLISNRLPAADLTFGDDFRYVGGQVVNLYGNALAEQHMFVKGPSGGPIERFYWVQFEHFLPSNAYTYNYPPFRNADISGLQFIYDVKALSHYRDAATDDPRSDGAAMAALLARHQLSFPGRVVRVRMFHLPTADRRTELMIIYGEALAESSAIPMTASGVPLDSAFADVAQMILGHARQGLVIRQH